MTHNKIEQQFALIQELKCLSRDSLISLTYSHEIDLPSSILIAFYEKLTDLVDGIIRLHQTNLDECAQSLIRIFLRLISNVDIT